MNTVAELKEAPKDQKLPFEAVLVLRKTAIKKARNDSEFLMVELGDKTGVFQIVCFANNSNYQMFMNMPEGTILRVQGQTEYYQNRFSPSIVNVDKLPDEEVSRYAEQLVETAPISLNELWKEFQKLLESIKNEELRKTVEEAVRELGDDFKTVPGAISMHHAYRSGLLEHTVRMGWATAALLPLYPEVHKDLAMAGVLLHDIGKCLEYTQGMATRKSQAGYLQGHVVLGYRCARRAAMKVKLDEKLLERLEHIILSHQGELEWGAAVKAATPEAVFVSMVDNLDAKMGMVQHALRATPKTEDFSEHVPGLGAPLLTRKIGQNPDEIPEFPFEG